MLKNIKKITPSLMVKLLFIKINLKKKKIT